MTEKIIIDGVNVAGCSLYLKDNGKCLRLLTDEERETECNAICDYGSLYRKEQLKRLEQENEKLKEDLKSQQMINLEQQEIALDYWNALEEIKNNFMCFRSCMIPFHVGDKDNLPHKMADAIQNYCESIINKINEVLE